MITGPDVFDWLGNKTPSVDAQALMTKVVDAVVAKIARTHTVPVNPLLPADPLYDAGWTDANFDLAVTMQAARIWQRKDSPGGVIANSEFGAIRVTRIDSDIADMLSTYITFAFA